MSKFNDMLEWQIDQSIVVSGPNPLMIAYNYHCEKYGKMLGFGVKYIKLNKNTLDILDTYRKPELRGNLEYNGIELLIDDTLPDNVYKFD